MLKIDKKYAVFSIAMVFAVVAVAAPVAYARDGSDDSDDVVALSTELEQEKSEAHKSEIKARKTEREASRADKQQKLEAKKLEICQKKQTSINKVMGNITDHKTKQAEVFSKIADRVQAFYEEKSLSVDNYDELVKAVDDANAKVLAEIENLEASDVDFMCDSADPLKVSDAFKGAREGVVSAMKEYKTAVKDLIVGVKNSAEKTDDTESEAN
jgi:hypothetical protein